MHSPGGPSLRHEPERLIWKRIATGITCENAAWAVEVSQAVGSRWFRHCDCISLFMSNPISGRYLSFVAREEIALHLTKGFGGARSLAVSGAAHQPFRGSSPITLLLVAAVSSCSAISGTNGSIEYLYDLTKM